MIYQSDPFFQKNYPDIWHYGCYFMSICFLCDTNFNLGIMDHDHIAAVYKREEMKGDLGSEAFVEDPQRIVNHIVPNKVKFLGVVNAFYETRDKEREILCWHKDGTDFNHFTYGSKGIVVYDPWSAEGSDSVKNGSLIGKRVFQIG